MFLSHHSRPSEFRTCERRWEWVRAGPLDHNGIVTRGWQEYQASDDCWTQWCTVRWSRLALPPTRFERKRVTPGEAGVRTSTKKSSSKGFRTWPSIAGPHCSVHCWATPETLQCYRDCSLERSRRMARNRHIHRSPFVPHHRRPVHQKRMREDKYTICTI